MNNHMMAAVLYGKEHLQVEPVAVPKIDSGDILVRVKVALDLRHGREGLPPRLPRPDDRPAGRVRPRTGRRRGRASARVSHEFTVGERVVAANSAPCEECYFCKRDLQNLCEDMLFNNGAYAEYIRIPARIVERNTYRIPEHVGYQDAALVEPLACVLRGLEETGIRPGDGGDYRARADRPDVRPTGESVRRRVIAIGRRKTQLDRAAALGAE